MELTQVMLANMVTFKFLNIKWFNSIPAVWITDYSYFLSDTRSTKISTMITCTYPI